MSKPDFVVKVMLSNGSVTFQDEKGNALGELDVRKDSSIEFSAASGSDEFAFNYCYVSPSAIDPCPGVSETPANPDEFTVSPEQPFSVATFTLEDADTDTQQTKYWYTVKITPTGSNTPQWADPQIVNYPD